MTNRELVVALAALTPEVVKNITAAADALRQANKLLDSVAPPPVVKRRGRKPRATAAPAEPKPTASAAPRTPGSFGSVLDRVKRDKTGGPVAKRPRPAPDEE